MRALFPGLRLSRSKVDLCDRCLKIDIELKTPGLPQQRKDFLEQEKLLHLDEAISQRRVWANFVKDYVGRVDPNLELPKHAFPLMLDDEVELNMDDSSSQAGRAEGGPVNGVVEGKENEILSTVQLQAEDYGGGIALPHYGFRRPSCDYFNSNLMTYNFVVSDITSGEN